MDGKITGTFNSNKYRRHLWWPVVCSFEEKTSGIDFVILIVETLAASVKDHYIVHEKAKWKLVWRVTIDD